MQRALGEADGVAFRNRSRRSVDTVGAAAVGLGRAAGVASPSVTFAQTALAVRERNRQLRDLQLVLLCAQSIFVSLEMP